MRKARWLRVALATVAVCGALMEPASAHEGENSRQGALIRQPGFCTNGFMWQKHTSHEITTWMTDCGVMHNTWHAQYQEYYKVPQANFGLAPGVFCFEEGWHVSGHQGWLTMHYPWDIWHWCNNGINVNVVLTIDSWQMSWKNNVGWTGGAWRPGTWHCHCP